MTEIIQLTGNKSEFSNYVTDPIVLKEDSKVCLNKGSFSVPVIVNRDINFPYSGLGLDYTKTFFKVALNGVENDITYQEFYNAYFVLDTLQNVAIEDFYDGTFPCLVDNIATYKDNAANIYNIPTFMEVVSQACDTSFDYYKFSSDSVYEPVDLGDDSLITSFIVNGKTINEIKNFRSIKQFGLVSQYMPEKVTQTTSTPVAWTPGQVNNFTPNGDGIVSGSAAAAMAVCPNTFDPNGGYIAATPQIGNGKAALGLIFMGQGQNDPLNITGVYQPENFDVGIEYELLGSGERVLQIIDGNQKFVYYDNTASAEVVSVKPNYVPPNQIYTWDHNVDKFWFLVRKGRPMNGTTEFTTTIIQGPGATPENENNRIIYVAKTTLNSSEIDVKTLAYSLGTGNGFDNWEFIPKTTDSQFEDDYQQLITAGNIDGISSANSLIFTPKINSATTWEDEDNFWNRIGITQDINQFNVRSDFESDGWNKKINWSLPKNLNKNYWFGQEYISNILNLSAKPNFISFNKSGNVGFVSTIPREINVSIMDLPITPNVGSFIGANNEFTSGNINKVVNYVQTDKEDLNLEDNRSIDYVYEAFNLVYRKMNNQYKMPITQMKIKLSYKDFTTNREQEIPNISGVAKLEILFD